MLTWLKSRLSSGPKQSGESFSIHKQQGDAHVARGELHQAATCYRQALAITPDSVDARVGLGFVLSEQQEYDEAEHQIRQALSIDAGVADAHYLLGTIVRNRDDVQGSIDHFSRALELKPDLYFAHRDLYFSQIGLDGFRKARETLERAITVFPDSAEFLFYLGNVLGAEGDFGAAANCYRKSLASHPASAQTHKNLGDALRNGKRVDEASASYREAVRLQPDFTEASIDLGKMLEDQGKVDEAIDCYRRAVAAVPGNVALHQFLGNALLARGAREESLACYKTVMQLDPDNSTKHLVAALSGQSSERAPSGYVETLFDQYAHKFESHLVAALRYDIPREMAEMLGQVSGGEGKRWAILDLGCGTGLVGAALQALAREIVGVDLSSKMLEKARERNLYDRLEQSDLETMMAGEPASRFDVVVAADVFIYVGKLDELAFHTHRLLRPGGFFAFSLESLDALSGTSESDRPAYKLNVTGRYAHSLVYLAGLAAANGFEVLKTLATRIRVDKGVPVEGYLVLWRR